MTSHPNRRQRNPKEGAAPTPAQIRAAREAAGLTIPEAAALILNNTRAWQNWEAGPSAVNRRPMNAGLFLLFQLLTGQRDLDEARRALKFHV